MFGGRKPRVVFFSIFLIAQVDRTWGCEASSNGLGCEASSKYGLTLNHTHFLEKTVTTLSDCLDKGEEEKDAQSVSYSLTTGLCKLFNSSHLQFLNALIPEQDTLYMHNPYNQCNQQAVYNRKQVRNYCNLEGLCNTSCGHHVLKVILEEAHRLGGVCNPADSCQQLRLTMTRSGPYWIKTNTSHGRSFIYCHMESIQQCKNLDGWTLVTKLDGNKMTFEYTSSLWENKVPYQQDAGASCLDDREAKTAAYWSTPFQDICLGMKVSGDLRWINLNKPASSLHALVSPGKFIATTKGRSGWKSIINGSSLQLYCDREGINNDIDNYQKVRFGIIGNDGDNCAGPDSRIGFGGHGSSNACGNVAAFSPDNGDKNTKGFGYILVR